MQSRTVGAVLLLVVGLAFAACTDTNDYVGAWQGPRVGDASELRVGGPPSAIAALEIVRIDSHGLAGRLSLDGLATGAHFTSIPGAEADVLADVTFSGAPLRVYFAFVPTTDGGGDLTAVIALFDHRIELRLMRGGSAPVYAIFRLAGAGS